MYVTIIPKSFSSRRILTQTLIMIKSILTINRSLLKMMISQSKQYPEHNQQTSDERRSWLERHWIKDGKYIVREDEKRVTRRDWEGSNRAIVSLGFTPPEVTLPPMLSGLCLHLTNNPPHQTWWDTSTLLEGWQHSESTQGPTLHMKLWLLAVCVTSVWVGGVWGVTGVPMKLEHPHVPQRVARRDTCSARRADVCWGWIWMSVCTG